MSNHGIAVSDRYSDCIKSIVVNPVLQTADVSYKDNDIVYQYSNVPAVECYRIIHHDDISLGLWVNKVCKQPEVKCRRETFGY